MKILFKRLILLPTLLASCFAAAAASDDLNTNEAKMVGVWQEGMTQQIASMDASRIAKLRKIGVLRNIVEYKADRTFVMYPRCQKAEELQKAGYPFISGTWALNDTGELTTHVSKDGKGYDFTGVITWRGDQMISTMKGRTEGVESGRYVGTLPPKCD
ncbi:MAG: hypothetical protein JO269_03100 [Burkholderiaceae bacterium]|nr:hypothetical protein [Burkholderiaceae bacterium]